MIKFIKCPVIAPNGTFSSYHPKTYDIKAANPSRPFRHIKICIKTNPENGPQPGFPSKVWCMCLIRGADLSDIDADTECVDLIDGVDVDDNFSLLKSRLKNKTLASLTAAKRNKLKALATSCEVDSSVFVGTDSVWKVLKACFDVQDGALDDPNLDAVV